MATRQTMNVHPTVSFLSNPIKFIFTTPTNILPNQSTVDLIFENFTTNQHAPPSSLQDLLKYIHLLIASLQSHQHHYSSRHNKKLQRYLDANSWRISDWSRVDEGSLPRDPFQDKRTVRLNRAQIEKLEFIDFFVNRGAKCPFDSNLHDVFYFSEGYFAKERERRRALDEEVLRLVEEAIGGDSSEVADSAHRVLVYILVWLYLHEYGCSSVVERQEFAAKCVEHTRALCSVGDTPQYTHHLGDLFPSGELLTSLLAYHVQRELYFALHYLVRCDEVQLPDSVFVTETTTKTPYRFHSGLTLIHLLSLNAAQTCHWHDIQFAISLSPSQMQHLTLTEMFRILFLSLPNTPLTPSPIQQRLLQSQITMDTSPSFFSTQMYITLIDDIEALFRGAAQSSSAAAEAGCAILRRIFFLVKRSMPEVPIIPDPVHLSSHEDDTTEVYIAFSPESPSHLSWKSPSMRSVYCSPHAIRIPEQGLNAFEEAAALRRYTTMMREYNPHKRKREVFIMLNRFYSKRSPTEYTLPLRERIILMLWIALKVTPDEMGEFIKSPDVIREWSELRNAMAPLDSEEATESGHIQVPNATTPLMQLWRRSTDAVLFLEKTPTTEHSQRLLTFFLNWIRQIAALSTAGDSNPNQRARLALFCHTLANQVGQVASLIAEDDAQNRVKVCLIVTTLCPKFTFDPHTTPTKDKQAEACTHLVRQIAGTFIECLFGMRMRQDDHTPWHQLVHITTTNLPARFTREMLTQLQQFLTAKHKVCQ